MNPKNILWQDQPYIAEFIQENGETRFEIQPDDEGDYYCGGKIYENGYGFLNDGTSVTPWMLYPSHLSILDIARATSHLGAIPPDSVLLSESGSSDNSRCFEVSNSSIQGQVSCRVEGFHTLYSDGTQTIGTQISWGNSAVRITVEDRTLFLEGEPTRLYYDIPSELDKDSVVCIELSSGGFCYTLQ